MAQVAASRRRLIGAASSFLAVAVTANAQTLSEQDFIGDLPVVLSASRLAQPKQEAPAAITVIGREQIEASPAVEIADLLRLVPGYQVGLVSGSERSITSHGLADQLGRRMQVLVDGRSVYDPFFGGALWQSLPISLAEVERIEVIRGPNAAAFGANAFQGAINIVTRAPGAVPETRANILAGSLGTRRLHATRDWVAGRHRLQLNLGYEEDDGFPQRHDDIRSTQFNARLQSQLTPRDRLDVQLGGRETDLQLGYAGDAFQPERDTSLLHHYQQLTWERFLDDGSDLRLQLYHTYQDNKDGYLYLGLPIDRNFVSQRSDAELQWRLSPSNSARLVLGAGWRLDQGNDSLLLDPLADNSRTQWRLFAHGEQRLAQDWLLQAGLMAEDFEEVGRYLSPRVSLNYQYLPRHALRLSAARGFRIPSLFEQDASFRSGPPVVIVSYISAPDLKAERITAYEIGLIGDFADPKLSYDLKLFHHTMEDLIFPAENLTTLQWEFHNSGTLYLLGLELGLHAQLTPRTRVDLAYSLADASGQWLRRYTPGVPITPADTRNARPEVPQHTIGLMVSHRFAPSWLASLAWSYNDYTEWLGEGDRIKSHQRLDMKLSRELRIGGSQVRLELIGQNVLNKTFYDFNIASSTNPGNLFERRIYGQIVISR